MAAPIKKSVVEMTHTELYQHVRSIATDTARISLSVHTKWVRMPQRSITIAEIAKILQMGLMHKPAEPGKYPDEMKCRFDGKDTDGNRISVVVAVSDSRPKLMVITVIRYS